MSKNTLDIGNTLTVCTSNPYSISLIVTDNLSNILHMTNTTKHASTNYHTRRLLIENMKTLINEYTINTIIMEENKLFIDSMDKFPDPYVLRNVLLGFQINTSIEDNFYSTVTYLLELPEFEWKTKILNKKVKYAIDLYKTHIKLRQFSEEQLQQIETNNYYKAICLSESVLFDTLMNKKYLVNKGE